jgi:hypothetical protein
MNEHGAEAQRKHRTEGRGLLYIWPGEGRYIAQRNLDTFLAAITRMEGGEEVADLLREGVATYDPTREYVLLKQTGNNEVTASVRDLVD